MYSLVRSFDFLRTMRVFGLMGTELPHVPQMKNAVLDAPPVLINSFDEFLEFLDFCVACRLIDSDCVGETEEEDVSLSSV
jgi:hypothetical protein